MVTKELVGKILGDLYDVQYEINVAQTAIRTNGDVDYGEFSDCYHDLETANEKNEKVEEITKLLEPYDK